MSKALVLKATTVGLLAAAYAVGHARYARLEGDVLVYDEFAPTSYLLGLLLFGIVNVLFVAPGTAWIRAAAVVMTIGVLLMPHDYLVIAAVLAWLVWPPAFMVAWALARDRAASAAEPHEEQVSAARARIALAALIGAVAGASFVYRMLVAQSLQQTAALFVGIPTILAVIVVFGVSPRSATGVACKAVTVGLLVSLLFLGEGVLCVAMSAPLFYTIAIVIARIMDWVRQRNQKTATLSCSAIVALVLVPMSLEGVTELTTLNRDESVGQTKIVLASPGQVERALFEPPRFDRALPLYLRAGFPSPVSTRIERGGARMRWMIEVRGGEMRVDGMEPRTGDLILELAEARPGLVRWQAVSDTSHMTHFLTWREVIVEWRAVDAHSTEVTWTLRYRRGLDPAWYFGPLERHAARLAAGYLIEAVATP